MLKLFFSLTLRRASGLVVLIGLASFMVSYGVLTVFASGWASAVIRTASETVLIVVVAAVIAQFTMSVAGALVTRQQSREIEQMRTAIDSMPQGLCMFDARSGWSSATRNIMRCTS